MNFANLVEGADLVQYAHGQTHLLYPDLHSILLSPRAGSDIIGQIYVGSVSDHAAVSFTCRLKKISFNLIRKCCTENCVKSIRPDCLSIISPLTDTVYINMHCLISFHFIDSGCEAKDPQKANLITTPPKNPVKRRQERKSQF